MSHKKFVLQVIGRSCSGKSTLETRLGEMLPGTYLVAFDKLKWLFSGYNRDQHRELIKQLLRGYFEVVCTSGVPVMLSVFLKDEEEFQPYAEIAARHGYTFHAVYLTAPKDVLLERFRARLAEVTARGGNMSVRDEGTYLKNMEFPLYVPEGTPTFDTSVLSVEEIAPEVVRLIREANASETDSKLQ